MQTSYERAEWNEKVISMPEVPSDHSCAKGAWKNRDFVSEMPVLNLLRKRDELETFHVSELLPFIGENWMFGYVTANKPELKIKNLPDTKDITADCVIHFWKNHGRRGQMTLTYDMTFLVILLSSLYEPSF